MGQSHVHAVVVPVTQTGQCHAVQRVMVTATLAAAGIDEKRRVGGLPPAPRVRLSEALTR